jgi:uncharacterized membrane protein
MEVCVTYFKKHEFVNRGFLIGPYCPIYGWGCILINILLNQYKSNVVVVFILIIIICSILEYLTSYVMEKIFHIRWWDYSNRKYNLNGRICLSNMLAFGVLGCLVIYIVNPFFLSLINKLPINEINIIALILLVIFLIDNIISTKIIFSLRNTVKSIEKDATAELTKTIKEIFLAKNYLYKRIIKSHPTMKHPKDLLIQFKRR